MGMGAQAVLTEQVEAAAKAAGLFVVSSEVGEDFSGNSTTRFKLALIVEPVNTQVLSHGESSGISATNRTHVLELSEQFDFSQADLLAEVGTYLSATAKRLKNPRPDCYLTLHGLPLS